MDEWHKTQKLEQLIPQANEHVTSNSTKGNKFISKRKWKKRVRLN